jgi:hypothetical protein
MQKKYLYCLLVIILSLFFICACNQKYYYLKRTKIMNKINQNMYEYSNIFEMLQVASCSISKIEKLKYSNENDTVFKLIGITDYCGGYIICWNKNDTITEYFGFDDKEIKSIQNDSLTAILLNFVSKWNFKMSNKSYMVECPSVCDCGYEITRIIFDNKKYITECYHFYVNFSNNNFEIFNFEKR